MRPRADRDLASVLSHFEPGWWEYSGQAGVGDVFFNKESGCRGALPLAFCLLLVPSVSGRAQGWSPSCVIWA